MVVIEQAPYYGGHYNTEYFTPPSVNDTTNWIDLGVQIFSDTNDFIQKGFGSGWKLDSKAFVERFAKFGVKTFDFRDFPDQFAVDMKLGIPLGFVPGPTPTSEFVVALGIILEFIISTYAWLLTADFPDEIPADLLLPFTEFIANFNLMPFLVPGFFCGRLIIGGLGSLDKLTALYALLNIAASTMVFNPSFGNGFMINGGCHNLYAGIVNYIGKKNLYLNAKTRKASRNSDRVKLQVWINKKKEVTFECKNLMIAFPETLEELQFLDLTSYEKDLFLRRVHPLLLRFPLRPNSCSE